MLGAFRRLDLLVSRDAEVGVSSPPHSVLWESVGTSSI